MGDQRAGGCVSVWQAESAPARPAPPLRGHVTSDVAIVGGGLTGVSTAWHLRSRLPELGIVLLEADTLGAGASGRNGGQVLNWINGVSPRTPEEAQRIHAATRAGIDLAEELAGRFAPPGTFRRGGCLEVYTDSRRAEWAEEHARGLAAAGIPGEFVSGANLDLPGARGGLLDPLAGRLNALALLRGMGAALLERGVALYEHTRVRRVRTGREIVVETSQGEVRCGALVLATNAYTPSLGFFRRRLLPLHSHVLATEPLSDAHWTRLGWGGWEGFSDDLDRIAYACRTPRGRLLLGGGGNGAYSYAFGGALDASAAARRRAQPTLERVLARYFPDAADAAIEHRWSGVLALTLDRVCSMGVGGPHRNVYHALGYSGHGLALALLAGRVIADLYTGNTDPWRALPFYQRRLPTLPPEPFRWLGYQVYTRLTGRSPRIGT